jgi:hypothetical protein
MQLISHEELDSAQSEIEFIDIPQTFTDLYLVTSFRTTQGVTNSGYRLSVNGSQSNFSRRTLEGTGSGVGSDSSTIPFFNGNGASTTADTFSNHALYFPNYVSSVAKSMSYDLVLENNATFGIQQIGSGLWNITATISSLTLAAQSSNFVQYSSATLYGITAGSDGIVAVS